jgi:hypothetical protein
MGNTEKEDIGTTKLKIKQRSIGIKNYYVRLLFDKENLATREEKCEFFLYVKKV